jgi:hypothetical protein
MTCYGCGWNTSCCSWKHDTIQAATELAKSRPKFGHQTPPSFVLLEAFLRPHRFRLLFLLWCGSLACVHNMQLALQVNLGSWKSQAGPAAYVFADSGNKQSR